MDYDKAERLAALLDGACSDEERQKLLALLADDDDDLEVFAAAGAALNQHEQEERDSGVTPLRAPSSVPQRETAPPVRPPRRWVRFGALGGLAVAAGIAALIALPRLRGEPLSGVEEVVAQLNDPHGPVSAAVIPTAEPLRSGQRPATDADRARLGAWLAVLQVAAGTDAATEKQAAGQIADLLEHIRVPGDLAERYRSIEAGNSDAKTLAPKLARRAESLAGGETVVRLGEWVQTARIAASREDRGFFATSESTAWLNGEGIPPRMHASAGALQRAQTETSSSAPNWDVVRRSLDEVYRAITS